MAQAKTWCEQHLPGQPYEIQVFTDEGYSGKLGWEPPRRGPRKYRPELARLVAAIAAGDVDLVIVYRMDRLTRSVTVWTTFVDTCLSEEAVRFVSICESIDLEKTEGRLIANVLASVGSFMREIIGENIRDSHRERKSQGLPIGRHYGWRSVPPAGPGERPTVEQDPERAPWVPKICEWVLRGWGMRRIARELNRQNAPCYPGADGWTRGSVQTVLKNALNAGYIDCDGELIIAHDHENRITERETYDAVQRELASRQVEGKRPAHGNLQPLYKIARCGACEHPLQVTKARVTAGVFSYRCRGSDQDLNATCSGWAKDTRLVDRVVLKQLAAFVERPEFRKLVTQGAREEILGRQVEDLRAEKVTLEQALAEIDKEEARLLRMYTKGNVRESSYEAQYAEIQNAREGTNV